MRDRKGQSMRHPEFSQEELEETLHDFLNYDLSGESIAKAVNELDRLLEPAQRPRDNAQLINQTSGEVEYYTPYEIILAARVAMGGIDLDPASSARANQKVGASVYFDQEFDGLQWDWFGRVWMNHPFGRETNPLWINKLIREYKSGRVKQACCLTFASTSEGWFKPLFQYPMCFLRPRTNFYLPDGSLKKGVTKGSVVTYLGNNWHGFWSTFATLGSCMIPIPPNS